MAGFPHPKSASGPLFLEIRRSRLRVPHVPGNTCPPKFSIPLRSHFLTPSRPSPGPLARLDTASARARHPQTRRTIAPSASRTTTMSAATACRRAPVALTAQRSLFHPLRAPPLRTVPARHASVAPRPACTAAPLPGPSLLQVRSSLLCFGATRPLITCECGPSGACPNAASEAATEGPRLVPALFLLGQSGR